MKYLSPWTRVRFLDANGLHLAANFIPTLTTNSEGDVFRQQRRTEY